MPGDGLNLDQLLASAIQHHQAGRLTEAEGIYREILRKNPRHADALHLLGVVACQVGKHDAAVELIGQAIGVNPNFREAHNNLGNALKEKGRIDEAIAAYQRALGISPDYVDAHFNFAIAMGIKGRFEEAVASYRRVIALRPEYPEAWNNLGTVLSQMGRIDEAGEAHRQAIVLRLGYAEAYSNLGNVLRQKGELDEAIVACRKAIALRENFPEAYNNLGNALSGRGEFGEAIAVYRRAISLRADYAEAFGNLGNALRDCGRRDEAIDAYRRAVGVNPRYAEVWNNLGNVLRAAGQLDEAIVACRAAIGLGNLKACNNLGGVLKDMGRMEEAIAVYRQAVVLQPENASVHSNLVFSLFFHPDCDARVMAEEQLRWSRQHAEPLKALIRPHTNGREPERRLRVGYVSPDFREHCQSMFTVPLLSGHNPEQVQIFCYSDVSCEDARTGQLRGCVAAWRNIFGQSDQAVAELIRRDRIDVLVDLTMHMAGNRLLAFARKPAPVQVCWLAYPGSTGIGAMDYRLSDAYLDPPGMDESVYSEKTVRLAETFWCYDPLWGRELAVNTLPALETGFVTFGCLNNFCKVHERLIRVWGEVMRKVEKSRLLILAEAGSHRQRVLEILGKDGIEASRVEFISRQSSRAYFELYHRIDLVLDSFPCNGHTTSLDALWMGVSVVSLVGRTAVGRGGVSILSNVGLPELAARTEEEYVRIAVKLARDLGRLGELRARLRERMEGSVLMDGKRFARNVEGAYRGMWREWCAVKDR